MPESFHEKAKDRLIANPQTSWFLSNTISGSNANDGFYFTHNFIKGWDGVSQEFLLFRPLLHKIDAKYIQRFRALLYPKTHTIEKHGWHTDSQEKVDDLIRPVRGCIYYINDNNGKTILKGDEGHQDVEIESVANRALFFDAHKLHRSTSCTDTYYRCAIITNFIPKVLPNQ
jgi:hypothetical protein